MSEDDNIGGGGLKTKFNQNVAAIALLKKLTAEKRPATRSEQKVLAKWVGWGGLAAAFRRSDGTVAKGWEKQAKLLETL